MTTPTVMEGQPGVLSFDITNVGHGCRDNNYKLQYVIHADPNQWSVGGAKTGVIHAPSTTKPTTIEVQATPKQSGSLHLPHISLMEITGSGEMGVAKSKALLSGAQCYNMSQWQYVEVHS